MFDLQRYFAISERRVSTCDTISVLGYPYEPRVGSVYISKSCLETIVHKLAEL